MNFEFNNWLASIVFFATLGGSFYLTKSISKDVDRIKFSLEKRNLLNILKTLGKSFGIAFFTSGILSQCLSNFNIDDAKPWVFILTPLYFTTFLLFTYKNISEIDKYLNMSDTKKKLFTKNRIRMEEEKLMCPEEKAESRRLIEDLQRESDYWYKIATGKERTKK